jgi:glycosyltransferase involved in cell wall biosynthesis
MNIVVNTQFLIKNKLEGLGNFTNETLKRITQKHKEHKFFFVFDRQFDKEFIYSENIKPIILYPQSRHPLLWYLRFEHFLPYILHKYKADIFFSPDGWSSLRTNANVKTHIVIHDINFETYPQYLPFSIRHYCKFFFPRFAQHANRIATVSEFSKNDIINKYHIPAQKIDVVYNGINDIFKPLDSLQIKSIQDKFSYGNPYFLFAGALIPRKNIINLLKAYDIFKRNNSTNINLILAGNKMWWTKEAENTYNNMEYKDNVIFTGRVNNQNLFELMASAHALIYISFFEGFGIPIIEAMRCNTPVIVANTTALPEIAGDAAMYVNPYSPEDIANAMTKIYKDNALRNDFILKSQERIKLFSWDKTATLLWNSIEKTLYNFS